MAHEEINRHKKLVSHIDWRWTNQPLKFFALDLSIMAFAPLFLVSVHLGLFKPLFVVFLAYLVVCVLSVRKKMTPIEYMKRLVVRYYYKGEWRSRS